MAVHKVPMLPAAAVASAPTQLAAMAGVQPLFVYVPMVDVSSSPVYYFQPSPFHAPARAAAVRPPPQPRAVRSPVAAAAPRRPAAPQQSPLNPSAQQFVPNAGGSPACTERQQHARPTPLPGLALPGLNRPAFATGGAATDRALPPQGQPAPAAGSPPSAAPGNGTRDGDDAAHDTGASPSGDPGVDSAQPPRAETIFVKTTPLDVNRFHLLPRKAFEAPAGFEWATISTDGSHGTGRPHTVLLCPRHALVSVSHCARAPASCPRLPLRSTHHARHLW